MQPEAEDYDGPQKEGHFQNYSDYSRTLRAWLVAYGIGGPVLFLTNDKVATRVAESGHANKVVTYFFDRCRVANSPISHQQVGCLAYVQRRRRSQIPPDLALLLLGLRKRTKLDRFLD